AGNAAIANAILSLAESLGVAVTAEGIERPGQLEWLRSRGCQEAQGFLLARPLAPADLERQFLAPAKPTAEAETLARRSGRFSHRDEVTFDAQDPPHPRLPAPPAPGMPLG